MIFVWAVALRTDDIDKKNTSLADVHNNLKYKLVI